MNKIIPKLLAILIPAVIAFGVFFGVVSSVKINVSDKVDCSKSICVYTVTNIEKCNKLDGTTSTTITFERNEGGSTDFCDSLSVTLDKPDSALKMKENFEVNITEYTLHDTKKSLITLHNFKYINQTTTQEAINARVKEELNNVKNENESMINSILWMTILGFLFCAIVCFSVVSYLTKDKP